MLRSRYGLRFSSNTVNIVTNSRSTSRGVPLALVVRRALMINGPIRPALVSPGSSTWLWYIQRMELGSFGPGPARSGTGQVYVHSPAGGTAASPLSKPEGRPVDGAPSE